MRNLHRKGHLVTPLIIFFLSLFFFNVTAATESPFTPKAQLLRYWNKEISAAAQPPQFLLNKASPLSAVDAAVFSKLAAANSLSTHLASFCAAANLLCFPNPAASLEKHVRDANFAVYADRNFTNYGSDRVGGADGFKNYSVGENIPVDTFRRYSRGSTGHNDKFNNYASDGNVVDQRFSTYGAGSTGGAGDFSKYADSVNVPNLRFASYSDQTNGRTQSFKGYSEKANAGDQSFANYAKNGNSGVNKFNNYGTSSNVIGSRFSTYAQTSNGGEDSFTKYAFDGNNPQNDFRNYGAGGNAAAESFKSYRDQSNVGDDSFKSYAKGSNGERIDFSNYGKSFNEGTDSFTGYGKGATGSEVGFKIYGVNNTFKDYAKKGVSFARYANVSSGPQRTVSTMAVSGSIVKRWVEPGRFFRLSSLKEGVVMPMPDITDKIPKSSFLPRTISAKLPFSSSKLAELKQIFDVADNSSMETQMLESLGDCEGPPSKGETKRCVASIEDMIDFSTSMLGRNVVVRTTDSVAGSKSDVMLGSVRRINGGRESLSVSCHPSVFPYLVYYCHAVPSARVYQADILDPISKVKINHGIALCHMDTSGWSPTHGAFLALASFPGRVEVCHWIFENHMTWVVSD